MSNNESEYSTIDLALAAYLKTIGRAVIGIEQKGNSNRRKAIIKFDQDSELPEIIRLYYDNQASVDPRTFYDNVRGLKSQIVNACRS
jgi:hypothetical protein